jgi:glycosyltransferase involved in cell wall biosynthesis
MKIAVIGPKGLPPHQGGIEHYCAEIYSRIAAEGHTVDLFGRSSYTSSRPFEKYNFNGVNVTSLPSINLKGVDAFFTSGLGTVISNSRQYDIIHFHALGPSLFSVLSRLTSKAKIVVTCQGLDWQRAKWGKISSRIIRMGEEAAVKFADEIIVVSKDLQSYFLETYGRKTLYIPTAPATYVESDPNFDYTKSLLLTPKKYILFLGRLVPEKRPDLLIDAFSRLNPPGWKLVFAGGVSDTHDYVSSLLNKIANNPNIVIAGELRDARLSEIVRGAGLFALPSDLEGLPLAMLEAMREGVPVLASNIPAHVQLISKNRGTLFQAGDLDSCVLGLQKALHHPNELAVMAGNAQRYVQKNHSWEHISSENLKLYSTLVGDVWKAKKFVEEPISKPLSHSRF